MRHLDGVWFSRTTQDTINSTRGAPQVLVDFVYFQSMIAGALTVKASFCLALIGSIAVVFGTVDCTQSAGDARTTSSQPDTVRFASYNVSMFREGADSLSRELTATIPQQVRRVASVIQRVRPDVLALMEFDYDSSGLALKLFMERCLAVGQMGADPITFPYGYQVPSNTGLLSGVDLNDDGVVQLPEDGFGFGRHPGQYAFALLSQYPLLTEEIRSFQQLLWKEMPQPRWPVRENGTTWYSEEARSVMRVSSKNHIDIPLQIGDRNVHVILAHPTPPVFDGVEDRNGLRNFDEIRLLKDYVEGAAYLEDDRGLR
ncbi:MAG: endonuclease/exonuclease/phosphatase family protein, partial [Saprospiraceae bacterium]|nr:endonuclease/exonuclease/phosphatase family protein [Saprospiraceae bacterium]